MEHKAFIFSDDSVAVSSQLRTIGLDIIHDDLGAPVSEVELTLEQAETLREKKSLTIDRQTGKFKSGGRDIKLALTEQKRDILTQDRSRPDGNQRAANRNG